MQIQSGAEMRDANGELLGRVVAEEGDHIKLENDQGKHYWVPRKLVSDDNGLIADQSIDRQARIVDVDPAIDTSIGNNRVDEASRESFPASDSPNFTPEKS